jgi:excisionase family DNA binding protein
MAVAYQPSDLISVVQAAKTLGVTRGTLYRWIRQRLVDSVSIADHLCIPKTEVKRLKAEGLPFEKPSASAGG